MAAYVSNESECKKACCHLPLTPRIGSSSALNCSLHATNRRKLHLIKFTFACQLFVVVCVCILQALMYIWLIALYIYAHICLLDTGSRPSAACCSFALCCTKRVTYSCFFLLKAPVIADHFLPQPSDKVMLQFLKTRSLASCCRGSYQTKVHCVLVKPCKLPVDVCVHIHI